MSRLTELEIKIEERVNSSAYKVQRKNIINDFVSQISRLGRRARKLYYF